MGYESAALVVGHGFNFPGGLFIVAPAGPGRRYHVGAPNAFPAA
jgi:hypothetical protein